MIPDRLTQALINLYINAIQAMPDGGELNVSAQLQGSKVLFRISDTGTALVKDTQTLDLQPLFYYEDRPERDLAWRSSTRSSKPMAEPLKLNVRDLPVQPFPSTFPLN